MLTSSPVTVMFKHNINYRRRYWAEVLCAPCRFGIFHVPFLNDFVLLLDWKESIENGISNLRGWRSHWVKRSWTLERPGGSQPSHCPAPLPSISQWHMWEITFLTWKGWDVRGCLPQLVLLKWVSHSDYWRECVEAGRGQRQVDQIGTWQGKKAALMYVDFLQSVTHLTLSWSVQRSKSPCD